MKLFFYNDSLNDITKNGSSTTASRSLNEAAQQLGYYSNLDKADFVIYLDALDTGKRFPGKKTVIYLISEYNVPPAICINNLKKDNLFCLAISRQTKDSFVNGGYSSELIEVAHLGFNPKEFVNLNRRARKFGDPLIYLTVNSSNQRSGYEILIPAFIEFAKGKNVKLVVKDQQNDRFQRIINEIDREKKIIYDGKNLSYEKLLYLMNSCHLHIYANSTTSFGMNPGNTALTGLPQIISKAAALTEFTSEETVSYIDCYEQEISPLLQAEWSSFGLVNNLLDIRHYCKKLITPRPKYESIINSLEESYKNYENLLQKNQKFVKFIGEQFTWTNSVQKIVEILKNK